MKPLKMRIMFFCFLLTAAGFRISAQENDILPEIEAKAGTAADALLEKLDPDWGRQGVQYMEVAAFKYKGFEVPLGRIWSRLLQDTIIEKSGRNLRVLSDDSRNQQAPDYRISGEILDVGGTLMIHNDLTVFEDMSIAASVRIDIKKSTPIARLLIDESMAENGPVFPDPFEPDGENDPVPISLSENGISRSLYGSDEDWFSVNLEDNDGMRIYTTGSVDTYMAVYDSGGNLVGENDDIGDDVNSAVSVSKDFGDAFLIKISGYDGATGTYTLNLEIAEAVFDEWEPNNLWDSATEVQPNGPAVETAFTGVGDTDWFTFSLEDEEKSYVELYTSGAMDTQATLYDADLNEVAHNDDGNEDYNMFIGTFLGKGTYYVEVTELNNEPGQYDFHLETKNLVTDQWEPDNSILKPRAIAPGDRQVHSFVPAGDRDWVRFELSEKKNVTLYTTGPVDTFMTLYNSDGERMTDDDDSGDDYNARIEETLEPGTYFLELSGVDESISEDGYTLVFE